MREYMQYKSIELQKELIIDKIVSIHYFEYMCDYVYEGEAHDFWEFLCVDKGTVGVVAGDVPYTLNKDQVIFHKPNEFHNVLANGIVAPNLVVIGFECHSPAMKFFENRILEISPQERMLLGNIIREARMTYVSRLDDTYCEQLIRKPEESVPFASEQLIQLYLQQFLIQLVRSGGAESLSVSASKSQRKKSDDALFYNIIAYMEDHINQQLSIEKICRDNLVGRSQLQKLFRENTGCGIIDYFSIMKINAAKQLIRSRQMNFSQIADSLGYNSIHYISRQFKKLSGMTPTEYAASIQSLSEAGERS